MNVDSGQNNQQPIDKQPEKTAKVSPVSNSTNQSQKQATPITPVAVPTEQKADPRPISQTTNQTAQKSPVQKPSPQDLPTQDPTTQNLPGLAEEITPKTFAGTGSAFAPPKTKSLTEPSIKSTTPTTKPTNEPNKTNDKAKPKKLKKTGSKKKAPLFLLIGFIILLLGGGGVFYTIQKQREAEIPTAPESIPEAAIETWCTLQFTVEAPPELLACGETGCSETEPCADGLTCINEPPEASATSEHTRVCSKITTTEYAYEAACVAAEASGDDLYTACCTSPICPEDATLSIDEDSPTGNTYIIATSTIDYADVTLQAKDIDGIITVLTATSGGGGVDPNLTFWTFETNLSLQEIASITFYVEEELCGTLTPEPLACGQTGCSTFIPCDDGLNLSCLEVVAATDTTEAVMVCAKPNVEEPEEYNFTETCPAGYDVGDVEATTKACCEIPMCLADATLTLAVADDESAIITATAPYAYTGVEIRLDDGDADGTDLKAFRDPVSTEEENDDDNNNYIWTWELEDINAYEIESITFYVDTDPDNIGVGGEKCGTYTLDITPTPTPVPGECGAEGCEADTDCDDDLTCIEADDDKDYCSMEEYETACTADQSVATCCTAPAATPTPTPTDEPGATNTPPPAATSTPIPTGPITVDTSIDCNDACTDNSDCTNISHICYNGLCRLDVNPEDEYCRTPAGETVVERIVEAPVSGPEDWLNYLKIGIGAIGAGLLMLLFL